MPHTIEIDRQEYEDIKAELFDATEGRHGDVILVSGIHEEHGWTTLRREAGRFFAQVDEAENVRAKAVP